MDKYKADKITRLMRELFKKYQIEIVQPNLDYIVNKFFTAYERLQKEMKNQEEQKIGRPNPLTKPVPKELIKFKHASFKKRVPLSKALIDAMSTKTDIPEFRRSRNIAGNHGLAHTITSVNKRGGAAFTSTMIGKSITPKLNLTQMAGDLSQKSQDNSVLLPNKLS